MDCSSGDGGRQLRTGPGGSGCSRKRWSAARGDRTARCARRSGRGCADAGFLVPADGSEEPDVTLAQPGASGYVTGGDPGAQQRQGTQLGPWSTRSGSRRPSSRARDTWDMASPSGCGTARIVAVGYDVSRPVLTVGSHGRARLAVCGRPGPRSYDIAGLRGHAGTGRTWPALRGRGQHRGQAPDGELLQARRMPVPGLPGRRQHTTGQMAAGSAGQGDPWLVSARVGEHLRQLGLPVCGLHEETPTRRRRWGAPTPATGQAHAAAARRRRQRGPARRPDERRPPTAARSALPAASQVHLRSGSVRVRDPAGSEGCSGGCPPCTGRRSRRGRAGSAASRRTVGPGRRAAPARW